MSASASAAVGTADPAAGTSKSSPAAHRHSHPDKIGCPMPGTSTAAPDSHQQHTGPQHSYHPPTDPRSNEPDTDDPDADSLHAFFSQSRVYYDLAWWAFLLVVLVPFCIARTLQTLCPDNPPSPTCPHPSLAPPPPPHCHPAPPYTLLTITLPTWRTFLPPPLRPLPPPPASTPHTPPTPPTTTSFPCHQPFPLQGAWTARHLFPVLTQLYVANLSLGPPLVTVAALLLVTAITLQQRWYVRWRTPLLMLVILMPRLASVVALLLLPPHRTLVTRAWAQLMASGGRAPATMVLQTIIFPLPSKPQNVVLAAQLLLTICNDALLLGPEATSGHLWTTAVRNLVIAILLQALVKLQGQFVRAQYLRRRRGPASGPAGSAGRAPCGSSAVVGGKAGGEAPPAAAAEARQGVQGGGAAAAGGAPAAAGGPAWAYNSSAGDQARAYAAGGGYAVGGAHGAYPAAGYHMGMQPYRRRAQYSSRLTFCRLAVKVDHHDAFEDRHAIRSAVEACLLEHLEVSAAPASRSPGSTGTPGATTRNAPTPSTATATATAGTTAAGQGQVQGYHFGHLAAPVGALQGAAEGERLPAGVAAGAGAAGAGGGRARRRRQQLQQEEAASASTAVSTIMLRGCLQLLINVYSWHGAGGQGGEGGGLGGGGGVEGGLLARVVERGLQEVGQAYGGQVVVSSAGGVRLRVVPVCVVAGVEAGQEVGVDVAGWAGGWGDRAEAEGGEQEAAVDVVVSYWREGVQCSERVPLEIVAGGAASRGCRVRLPPQLDAAPVDVHLVTACPGSAGVLLASATTMALPPAAALDLLEPLPASPGSTSGHSAPSTPSAPTTAPASAPCSDPATPPPAPATDGSNEIDPWDPWGTSQLLEDVAAAWKMLSPAWLGAGQAPCVLNATEASVMARVGGVRAYCADEGLEGLVGYVDGLLARAGGLVAPAPAASADTPSAATPATTALAVGACPQAAAPAAAPTPCAAPCPAAPPAAGARPTATLPAPGQPASGGGPDREAGRGSGSSSAVTSPAAARSTCHDPAAPLRTFSQEHYPAWKLLQGRRTDAVSALAALVLWGLFFLRESMLGANSSVGLLQVLPYACLDCLAYTLPLLVLAAAPDGVRMQRRWVMVVQSGLVVVKQVAVAACWVELPLRAAGRDPTLSVVVVLALLVPAMQRVGWKQQLLSSLLAEEVPRYLMLRSSCAMREPPAGARQFVAPDLRLTFLVPLVASAVAWLMEWHSLAAYRRLLALQARAAPGQGSKQKAE